MGCRSRGCVRLPATGGEVVSYSEPCSHGHWLYLDEMVLHYQATEHAVGLLPSYLMVYHEQGSARHQFSQKRG